MVLATAGEICGYIDNDLTNFIHTIIVLIEIATVVLLIIFGMLDFAKSVIASKEEETKKGLQIFIKRCIAAAVVFLVFSITQLLTGLVAKEDSEIWACASAIMNGTNKSVSSPKGDSPSESIDTLIEEACCTQAGGKINNGTCASWFDMDSNNNPTTRHEVDTERYNQCKEAQNRNKERVENNGTQSTIQNTTPATTPKQETKKENIQSCCTQAGGKIGEDGNCGSWFETDANGTLIKRHELDTTAFNKCMNK